MYCLVVESKPDDAPDDLRLFEPWDGLIQFAKSIDMSALDSHHHGHVPFVVLLTQQLYKWRSQVFL